MSNPTGPKAGVAAALAGLDVSPPAGGPEQMALFGGPAAPAEVAAAEKSGPGRPRGAMNRTTREWREFLIGRYGSPLEELVRIGMSSPAEIAREMHLRDVLRGPDGEILGTEPDLGEAARVKVQALLGALPYLAQKMPMAIEVEEKQRGLLTIYMGQATTSELPLAPDQTEQNQGVIDHEPQQSDGSKSETNEYQEDSHHGD